MSFKAIMKRLGLLLSGLVASILIAEVALRIWSPEFISYKAVRQSDPVFHHALRPNASYIHRTPEFAVEVKTNSMGLRDNEYVKASGREFRIIVLGDSFTEGLGVPLDSCFVKRLERRLNAECDHETRFAVFNFGVKGYSPIIEYLYLKDKGLALNPQLVILCYDMTDVQEDFLYGEDAEFDSTGAPIRVNPTMPDFGLPNWFPRGRFQTFYQEYSYIYAALQPLIQRMKPKPLYELGNIYAGRYMHTVDSTSERWETYFRKTQSYVGLIARMCRSGNIPFVLATYPCGHQVSSREWTSGRKFWGLESKVYNSAIFGSMLKFATHDTIPYLDMTATFRRRSNGWLYYPEDGHWTPAGHAVAADTLIQFLLSNNLIGMNSSQAHNEKF
jgi:hypothetical protein